MVSPFRKFQAIWEEFIKTKDKPHDYRNFIQCWLAQFWTEKKSVSSVGLVATKKQNYNLMSVPDSVKVLITGIDTQDDCLYIVTYGFGKESVWLINQERVLCDIGSTNVDDLTEIINMHVYGINYYTRQSIKWKVGLATWDSGGHRTQQIYEVVRKFPNVVAIKGRNAQSKSVLWSEADTHYNIRTVEYLDETESKMAGDKFFLPENVDNDFIVQFCNMEKIQKMDRKKGMIYQWESRGQDHYRYASSYAFAGQDIYIRNVGLLRDRLQEDTFIYNPADENKKPKDSDEARLSKASKYDYYNY
jgi:hypothetical protein